MPGPPGSGTNYRPSDLRRTRRLARLKSRAAWGRRVHTWLVERTAHLTVVIQKDGDGFVALCPEVDVASQGGSVEEARSNLEEAVSLFFETAGEKEIAERFQPEVYVTHLDVNVGPA